ncbi:MAG: hypothetical protein ACP5OU_01245 [Methanothrix sp.]
MDRRILRRRQAPGWAIGVSRHPPRPAPRSSIVLRGRCCLPPGGMGGWRACSYAARGG